MMWSQGDGPEVETELYRPGKTGVEWGGALISVR